MVCLKELWGGQVRSVWPPLLHPKQNAMDLSVDILLQKLKIAEMERDRWQRRAETDKLTDLPNRFALERRTHARDGWFVLCDLNGFKAAQDSHPRGHSYGDEILCEFADFLESTCRSRSTDRIASRLGGDEFVIWCPTEYGAQRIRDCVRLWQSQDGKVRCASGMGKTIRSADSAMYTNKRSA